MKALIFIVEEAPGGQSPLGESIDASASSDGDPLDEPGDASAPARSAHDVSPGRAEDVEARELALPRDPGQPPPHSSITEARVAQVELGCFSRSAFQWVAKSAMSPLSRKAAMPAQ